MFRNQQMNRLLQITCSAVLLAAMPMAAMAQQKARESLNFKSDQPIEIQGDRLEVMEGGRVNVLTGNVSVVQGPNLLRSAKMTVYFARGTNPSEATGNNIERIEVDGGVYVKSEKQVATGDRGSYDMKSEVLELSGKEVVLTEGDNVIVGCKLVIRGRNGQATLESCKNGNAAAGRVKMLITPPERNAQ